MKSMKEKHRFAKKQYSTIIDGRMVGKQKRVNSVRSDQRGILFKCALFRDTYLMFF